MNWLSPLTALYAGAITVPLFLLLYFLKLKRQEKAVPCTLLWKRAVQDLQVNAPFQRLRRNILLLIQFLALLAILAALAGPILSLHSLKTERYVLLIDNSASMNATDVEPSRLEQAKEQAAIFVSSLTEGSFFNLKRRPPQVMVITINDTAKVVCNFTSNKEQLTNSIEQIKPSDGGTNLGQGLALARAYCQTPDPETNNRTAEQAAKLLLFSDGGIRDTQNLKIAENEMAYHVVGTASDNVAITSMKARRSFENAEQVNVFAMLTNYNESAVNTELELSINGNLKTVKAVTIPGKTVDPITKKDKYGHISVDFDISSLEDGIIQLHQTRKDALGVDDIAWSVISAPRDVKALLVTGGNRVLESALQACRQVKLFQCSPQEFSQMDTEAMGLTNPYDIIILDQHDGKEVPGGCYLIFGKAPAGIGVETPGEDKNQIIVDYRAKHPVLNYVNMDNLFVGTYYKMNLPRDAEVLAEFDQTPAIGLLQKTKSTFILVGFDAMESNWPFEPGFVMFIYNSIAYLAEKAGLVEKSELSAAEPMILEGFRAGTEAVFSGPGYKNEEISVTESGKLRLPIMERVGLYHLEMSDSPPRVFAVNLLNTEESDIRPQSQLAVAGQDIKASEVQIKRFNLPIWPYIVAVVLLLVCVEWFVYNSKIRI
ncbi:MAG: VWA domain-containing protein [Planctomycetota bacterium]